MLTALCICVIFLCAVALTPNRTPAELWRWLRWTFRCLRGRRCADIVVTKLDVPPGSHGSVTFTCGGCGTDYRAHILAGNDGAFTQLERERIR